VTGRRFDPKDVAKLEDPGRRQWLPVNEVLKRLEVSGGQRIADLGAGTGYFTLPLAAAVGPRGRVTAVDAQGEVLEHLRAKLAADGAPRNVELVKAEAHATGLPERSCDLIFAANVWHELDNEAAVFAEVDRVLASRGRLAILDWRPGVERPPGPPPDHRIAAEEIVRRLEVHQFSVDGSFLIGPYAYLVIARRA
jgi:ubiquinone/menaquinone biosynthesis C-methylase UbiE